jgi:hypothetical protein
LLPDAYAPRLPVVRTVQLVPAPRPNITSLAMVAVGDFDGDGNDDIIWEVNGALEMQLMNGATRVDSPIAIGPPITSGGGVPVAFAIALVGDFDGDGRVDILWRAQNHSYVALMNGGTPKEDPATIPVYGIPAEWKVKVVADYDGDGKADLLWRNEGSFAGDNVIHYMNGSAQARIRNVQAFLPVTTEPIDP